MLYIRNPISGEDEEWHLGEPLPDWVADMIATFIWKVLEFQADGDELTTILEALIETSKEVK